ncbi:MAG: hypothetical protein NT053_15430 [Cyanobacteria bacterium]|nr:hypothetical protein [Cyanobacteriota bacterium]
MDASASTPGSCPGVENWFPCWRSWPGRIGEELEAQGFASPSIVVVAEVVAQRVEAQRVEACAPEPADAELPIPF